eukprot:COSAG01_NODE_8947_length_2606_cov_338.576785_1_plen_75_part_00
MDNICCSGSHGFVVRKATEEFDVPARPPAHGALSIQRLSSPVPTGKHTQMHSDNQSDSWPLPRSLAERQEDRYM